VAAEISYFGTFQKDSCVVLKQTCSNCTYSNLTSVLNPSVVDILGGQKVMTRTGTEYNYNCVNVTTIGDYIVNGFSDVDGVNTVWGYQFSVTSNGKITTISESYVYIIGLIFLVLMMVGIVFMINKLPSEDSRDDEGKIIQINMLKHLRPIFWVGIWVLVLTCIFILSNMGFAFLPDRMIGSLFHTIFQIFFWITIIGVPIYFIWIFMKFFQDKEFQRMIERGVDIGDI
jgi:hypothetical protein